jgi:hypothetical protein
MSAGQKQVRLEGSTRHLLPNAEVVGEVRSVEFRVTVTVRRRNELPSIEAQNNQKPRERTYMSGILHLRGCHGILFDFRKIAINEIHQYTPYRRIVGP